jgi:hypothetical protein
MENKQLDESGLNIIENPDSSFAFEWDPKDERWSWMNGLTDKQIKSIVEDMIAKQLEFDANDQQSMGDNE